MPRKRTTPLRIRRAQEKDIPLILDFIRKLARYERLEHELVATTARLRRHLFGRRPAAEVLIGEADHRPVAFALFFHNFSTFLGRPGIYIEDLFVDEACRGRGYGRALLEHLARLALRRGCGRLEWWVLDWNRDAIAFYRALGAVPMDEWTVYRVTGAALERLAGRRGVRPARG